MQRAVEVSVVIPTRCGGERFARVLEALQRQELENPFEVIVVDSGSTDGTPERAIRAGARLYSIRPEEFGHGRTRNLGVSLAQGRIVAFLTQDAIPAGPLWLKALTAAFADEGVAGVFGRQLPDATHPMEEFFLDLFYPPAPREESLAGSRSPQRASSALRDPPALLKGFFSNVNSAVHKSVWARYPFEENVLMSEDQYWAWAVLQAGYEIRYEPSAAVWHSHRYGLGQLFRRSFDSGASLRAMGDRLRGLCGRFGVRYLWQEFRWLAQRGRWFLIPYAAGYELTRGLGFWLGRRSAGLPKWLRRGWSL